jgi:hypothetical protein
MKISVYLIIAISLRLTFAAYAGEYNGLTAQGYRWVLVDGPYACTTVEDVQRIVAHRTDSMELELVENIRCYYLIPGTIVLVIKQDAVTGMSQIQLGSITRPLWTYTRFLSKHPVRDTYGRIERPEECGLIPKADTAVIPLPPDDPTARTQQNGNP